MQTKKCTKCGKILPLTDFNWRDKAKGTRRSECKYCHTAYMKAKYQEKKKIVQDIKAEKKCAKCGQSRGYVLDFHHIDPTQKDNTIARLTSNNYQLDKVYDEIKKCIVLCANCHRQFHHFQKQDQKLTITDYINS